MAYSTLPPHLRSQYQGDNRLRMAQALQQQGMSTAPVGHWLQGAARLAQALAGKRQEERVRDEYAQQAGVYNDRVQNVAKMLQSGDQGGAIAEMINIPGMQNVALGSLLKDNKDPLMQIYDPDTGAMRYVPQSQAVGQMAEAPDPWAGTKVIGDQVVRPTDDGFEPVYSAPTDRYEPVMDSNGNVIGQRNTRTGQVVSDPRAPDLLSPEEFRQQSELRMAGKDTTEINMGPSETREQEKEGERRVAEAAEIFDAAATSGDLMSQIQIAMEVNKQNPDLADTSRMQALLGNLGSSLGFSADAMRSIGLGDVTSAQQFQGVLNNLVLSKLQAQKGPQTENDARRVEETVANLGQTPEARDFLLRTARSMANKDIQRAKFFRDWMQEKGTYQGAMSAWNETYGSAPTLVEHPKHGMVFWEDWYQKAREANPDATDAELLEYWKGLAE